MHREDELRIYWHSKLSTGGRDLTRRSFLAAGTAAAATAALSPAVLAQSAGETETNFRRVRTQFIAALAAPDATSGNNAEEWGLWRLDPGPRGVRLNRYDQLREAGGVAPADWQFDHTDWWLEENGLIMEQPDFPLASGKYLVTGDREVVTVLTVHPEADDGSHHWELRDGATVYDVTHLRCRSARYTPAEGNNSCSPEKAQIREFPVTPGAEMPAVEGCNKQDYAVLFVIAVGEPA
jgi:hypothetical protein